MRKRARGLFGGSVVVVADVDVQGLGGERFRSRLAMAACGCRPGSASRTYTRPGCLSWAGGASSGVYISCRRRKVDEEQLRVVVADGERAAADKRRDGQVQQSEEEEEEGGRRGKELRGWWEVNGTRRERKTVGGDGRRQQRNARGDNGARVTCGVCAGERIPLRKAGGR